MAGNAADFCCSGGTDRKIMRLKPKESSHSRDAQPGFSLGARTVLTEMKPYEEILCTVWCVDGYCLTSLDGSSAVVKVGWCTENSRLARATCAEAHESRPGNAGAADD